MCVDKIKSQYSQCTTMVTYDRGGQSSGSESLCSGSGSVWLSPSIWTFLDGFASPSSPGDCPSSASNFFIFAITLSARLKIPPVGAPQAAHFGVFANRLIAQDEQT